MIFFKLKYCRLIFLALIIQNGVLAIAQDQFSFKSYNVKQGLSNNFVRNIIQGENGFIWIATSDGLNKFDGYSFKIFRNDPEDSNSLSNNNINQIALDKNGKIWLGTWGGGINVFDPEVEKFIRLPYELEIDGKKINASFINNLFNDSKGNIWVGINEAGLFKFNVDDFSFLAYQHKNNENGLSRNRVMDIEEDDKGNIWIATFGGGLNKLNPNTHQFTIYGLGKNHPDSLNTELLYSVFFDSKGRLWIGSWGDGLFKMDPETEKFQGYQASNKDLNSLKSNDIWQIEETNDGKIWIGSDIGLALYNEKQDNFQIFTHDPNDNKSLPANSIKGLTVDNNGRLWIGTYNGGIALLDQNARIFKHYYQKKENKNFLSSNTVSAFLEINPEEVLIGTDGGGLNLFNKKKGTFINIERESNDGILGNKIKYLYRDKRNRIWIGYWGEGFDLFDLNTKSFRNYKIKKGENTGPNSNNILSIAEDENGAIWLGTFGGGLNKFDPEKGTFEYFTQIPNEPSSLADINIWDFIIDKNGKFYNGTSNGFIDYYDPAENKVIHIRTFDDVKNAYTPHEIFEDSKGQIWIGTGGGGLKLVNTEDFSLKSFNKTSGLASNNITSIIEDKNGILWLGTYMGITKFDPKVLKFTNYDISDGLQDLHFNPKAATLLSSGELMFGGVNGFNIFHPDSIPEVNNENPLVLTNFQIFNQDVKIGAEGSPLNKNISQTNEIVINQDQMVISFEYALISFTGTDKARYAYRLKNFAHPQWQYVGKERKVTYTNLEPGTYTFEVRASKDGTDWAQNEARLVIKVLPPWWATWWFRIIASTTIIGLGVLLYKIRFNFLERQKKILKKMVEIRTRELDQSNKILREQKTEINAQNEELQASQEELNAQNQELTATLEKLKETQGQLVQSEKMASLGILTAGIAHEINNPINFINAGVIGLKKYLNNIFNLIHRYEEITPENVEEKLKEIQEFMEQIQFNHTIDLLIKVSNNISIGVERTTEIIKGLKIFSRQDNQQIDNYNIHNGLDSTLLLISSQFKNRVDIIKEYNPLPEIKACPGKINQVFMNILINAFQAIDGEGKVTITTSTNGTFAKVAIKDNGSGMPQETSKQIFDPFFTTKEVGKGTGLGLFISHGILEEHGGKIEVSSKLGHGTEFTIYLPFSGIASEKELN
ncbi:two-component regulator propeller domain-containing protein [Flexithrix dorotheae]|uniref:two-component regulator propeller domain-containing protein n=1 Tax=Flexithrix dorotheae TaxID=70993 RepID=UPI000370D696|nr:two-component regulator propeller domain-containing protein [Flexithrix dorotheae]